MLIKIVHHFTAFSEYIFYKKCKSESTIILYFYLYFVKVTAIRCSQAKPFTINLLSHGKRIKYESNRFLFLFCRQKRIMSYHYFKSNVRPEITIASYINKWGGGPPIGGMYHIHTSSLYTLCFSTMYKVNYCTVVQSGKPNGHIITLLSLLHFL